MHLHEELTGPEPKSAHPVVESSQYCRFSKSDSGVSGGTTYSSNDFIGWCTRAKDFGDASSFQFSNIAVWHDSTDHHRNINTTGTNRLYNERCKGHMGTGQHRETNDINVFVNSRSRNCFGRLEEARVNDFDTGIAQQASDNFDTTVMAIKPNFGNENSQ